MMELKILLEKYIENKAYNELIESYIKLKKEIGRIELIEKECKEEVLKNNVFLISTENFEKRIKKRPNLERRITESIGDYLMSREDLEKYLKLVHELRTSKGIKAKNWDSSSTYALFEKMQEAEKIMIDKTIEIAPNDIKEEIKELFDNWKYRGRAIEILTKPLEDKI